MTEPKRKRLPEWVKAKQATPATIRKVKMLLREEGLNTVCESARCPNIGECFARPTATFMILGKACTRSCAFCAISHHTPEKIDPEEPAKIARASQRLGLKHVVITSVTRDDLPDGGASHFAACITALHQLDKVPTIEVLTPDFKGNQAAIQLITDAAPTIFNHNLETVPHLYKTVRPQADYQQSLALLATVKKISSKQITKAGIMVGLGETLEEVVAVLKDLRAVDCNDLTVGQYLQPTRKNIPVVHYWTPEQFADLKKTAQQLGFRKINCQPLARSSYHASAN